MAEDYLQHLPALQAEQAALGHIDSIIKQFGKSLSDFNLPPLDEALAFQDAEDLALLAEQASQLRPQLNPEQTRIADAVINAASNVANNIEQDQCVFFLDGPAGTGKTFTYNYLIKELKGRGIKVATAAYTGIAATLLSGGRTLHSLFKLPVPILDTSTCNVAPTSAHAEMLRNIGLFLIDEASMISTHVIQAIDRLLRDICNNDLPFGERLFF